MVIVAKLFYGLNVGPGWRNVAPGFVRVIFSFFCSVAVARLHKIRPPTLKMPSWVFIAVVPVLLSLRFSGPFSHKYELMCIIVLFPAIVYWGAEATERRPWLGSALGDSSYALYTIHYPLWVLCAWIVSRLAIAPSLAVQLLFVVAVTIFALGLNVVDARVRRVLTSWVRKSRLRRSEIEVSEAT